MSPVHRLWSTIASVALVAFGCTNSVAPGASITFVLDAPLCSSVLPIQFLIDSALVGTDTFRIRVPGEHTRSRAFGASTGRHVVSARLLSGLVWPDTTVTLLSGQAATVSLPLYCS